MREVEPLTDAALDREIADALSIDPSPEFAARVRQRVRLERHSSSWHWGAFGAVGAIAAVALTALYAAVVRPTPRPSSSLVARSISGAIPTLPIGPGIVRIAENAAIGKSPAPTARPFYSHASRMDTAVLVDEREARAIRELISGVVNGRIDLAPLLNVSASERAFLDVIPIRESDAPPNPWPSQGGTTETGVPQ